MNGLCECGCGLPAPLRRNNNARKGWVNGQTPCRFISGHAIRVHSEVSARGCPAMRIKNTTHGMCYTSEFRSYINAKKRCTNPNFCRYDRYGGRGIKFLFTSFEQFFAELGLKPTPQHSVDRFPNCDGNYEPGNVRWATKKEQQKNKTN
jgi:hypothetical protein